MKPYNKIIFDLDSTLVNIEGLDWLAENKGVNNEVALLTLKSMNGELKLEDVFSRKMELIKPSYDDLISLGNKYCQSLTPGTKEVISIIRFFKKEIWILTGNFDPAVSILAGYLEIPAKNVINNSICFYTNGKYKSYDNTGNLSNNFGKKLILQKMRKGNRIVYIGDSAVDVKAKNAVDLFIGFGGVIHRDFVKKNSDIYISSKNMLAILSYVLTKDEKMILKESKFKEFLEKM